MSNWYIHSLWLRKSLCVYGQGCSKDIFKVCVCGGGGGGVLFFKKFLYVHHMIFFFSYITL